MNIRKEAHEETNFYQIFDTIENSPHCQKKCQVQSHNKNFENPVDCFRNLKRELCFIGS